MSKSIPKVGDIFEVGDICPIGGVYQHSCGKMEAIEKGTTFPQHTFEAFHNELSFICSKPDGKWILIKIWGV
ncbi:MAG TPA: hypothetical protein PL190_02970 [Caldisericia bacterium]|nr:MAG: hypothetical protein BWX90_01312 [bacterium ADurb.Bin132]HNW32290.1 hypothetical protein [Caldisericia bacterium]HNY61114.1 hypothetical protein [Caldisericia bacterium]HOC79086.1 hypothetical protein [Caldisericia bacterium]HOG70124.1 hypothetical protein [Caldisericia bacterium]